MRAGPFGLPGLPFARGKMAMSDHFKSIIAAWALIALVGAPPVQAAPRQKIDARICDQTADFFLGIEDYPEAIRLHLAILSKTPNDALAHYHLGFAYGMVGRSDDEIREYEQAADLGLKIFDLYLNLGLAFFERGELLNATRAFETAASLTDSPEPHFDLALAYERRGKIPQAQAEIGTALARAPTRPDYLNLLAALAAEKGDIVRACDIWRSILSVEPGYEPAAANLRLLKQLDREIPRRLNAQGAQRIAYADAKPR
jgi:tetratricopeptide (TPR) repeat protein